MPRQSNEVQRSGRCVACSAWPPAANTGSRNQSRTARRKIPDPSVVYRKSAICGAPRVFFGRKRGRRDLASIASHDRSQLAGPSPPRYPTLCWVVQAVLTEPKSFDGRRRTNPTRTAATQIAPTIPRAINPYMTRQSLHTAGSDRQLHPQLPNATEHPTAEWGRSRSYGDLRRGAASVPYQRPRPHHAAASQETSKGGRVERIAIEDHVLNAI